jgi:NDP-sugar pyrophosphorylase family protein
VGVKAMVLAAGIGTRMRPLSYLRAKPVLPVLNRPLLHWTLENLAGCGVRDVVINLHHLPETVTRSVGRGSRFGLRIRYSREPRILGTGGGPRRARRFLGHGPVLVVNGDMAFDFDLGHLLERHRASGAVATLALKPNPDPDHYGPIITDRRGRVRALPGFEARRGGTVSLFTGVHVLEPRVLERLPAGPSDSIRDLYAGLLRDGETIAGVRVQGAWHDLSSPLLYLRSHLSLLKRGFAGVVEPTLVHPRARVHATARVERSVIGPGSVVGAGARVRRSVLWERVRVGRGARVTAAVLTDGVGVAEEERVSRLVAIDASRLRGPQRRGLSRVGSQLRMEIVAP